MVVVVHHRELAQPEVPSQRRRFARHPFHEIAIAGKDPGPVIHDGVVRPIEMLGQEALGDGHSHRIAKPLTQGPGRGLDSRRVSPLGVPGVFDPHCLKFLISSSDRSYPVRCSSE